MYVKAREIPLNNTARTVLLDYLKTRPTVQSPLILISVKHQEPMTAAGVEYACEKYGQLIGVRLYPHMLRRTFGTKIARTHPIEVVADLLGHTSVDTTRTYYLGQDKAKRLAAVESIEG
jgi:integrase